MPLLLFRLTSAYKNTRIGDGCVVAERADQHRRGGVRRNPNEETAQILADGKPDIARIKPFTLTMPDNRYWAVGKQIGKAWSDGRGFAKG